MQIRALEAKRTTCKLCGATLPKSRRSFCLSCKPPRSYKNPFPDEVDMATVYTLEDRAAQADARGISYGKLMALIHDGLPLPPLKRSVNWPHGSYHQGQEQLPA